MVRASISIDTRDNTARPAASAEQMQLMLVASRLYYMHAVRQRDIATRLGVSQAKVSRLLRQAEQEDIVRRIIVVPEGIHPALEDRIERTYGLVEAHVIDLPPANADIAAVLGRAAARYYGAALLTGRTIGFTSWSTTLREMAFALEPQPRNGTTHVVEMLGGLGPPQLQHSATRATQALASALGAEPVFLRTPGVVTDPAIRAAALRNPHVKRALGLLDDLDIAFVGVGPACIHSELEPGENFFDDRQLDLVRAAGAAGQLDLRFLDGDGRPVDTPLDDLVVGTTLQQLARARRRVVVAGGESKHAAIRAALVGGWIDVLITDVVTARHIGEENRDRPLAPHEPSK